MAFMFVALLSLCVLICANFYVFVIACGCSSLFVVWLFCVPLCSISICVGQRACVSRFLFVGGRVSHFVLLLSRKCAIPICTRGHVMVNQ